MGHRTLPLPPLVERRPRKTREPAIILYDGDEIGGLHSLTKDETVIGRTAGCDIVIPESRVSRRHAMIRRTQPGGDEFEIVDLGSRTGNFLEGGKVTRAVLQSGDKVGIGGRILSFALLDKADVAYQSRIVQMIHVDELTGLLTKRSLFRALEMEIVRAQRYRHPISVLMMDLDHFKQVNDTYGHLVGSQCLADVGRLIRESTRETDVSGRYGGEEFVTFLPESDSAAGLIVAERIRETMDKRTFQVRRDHLPRAHLDWDSHVAGRRPGCPEPGAGGRQRALSREEPGPEPLRRISGGARAVGRARRARRYLISFNNAVTAASSCSSRPLITTSQLLGSLMSGSVWLFSRYFPVVESLTPTGGTPQRRLPSCNVSHPANVHVPGVGIPTSLPRPSAFTVYA